MNSILRIYVPSTLNVAARHTEVLTVTLDLTPDISNQPTLHDQEIGRASCRERVLMSV